MDHRVSQRQPLARFQFAWVLASLDMRARARGTLRPGDDEEK
jgi:hypothetical protein